MKSITIFGNIGKDPVLRTTQQGDKVCGFGVGVQDGFGDNKRTIWFDVSFWGKRGEVIANNCHKGDKICVTGELSTREHDGKTYLTLRGNDFSFGGKSEGGQRSDQRQQSTDYDAPPTGNMDDEIPF